MKAIRVLVTVCSVGLASAAVALPPFVADFAKAYKIPAGSALSKANCASCHVGMTAALNAYGKDLKKVMKNKKLDVVALRKVEALDSDKDKAKNGAEIKAGTLPGDAKSKPKKK